MYSNRYEEKIYSVFNYIESKLEDEIDLSSIAFHSNFSVFHFNRVFANLTGEAPVNYLRRLKLEKAAFDLKVSTKQIIQIALDSGYESHESFTRAFKKRFLMSPKQFRDKYNIYKLKSEKAAEFIFVDEIKIVQLDSFKILYQRYTGAYSDCPGPYNDSIIWKEFVNKNQSILPENAKLILAGVCHDDPEITDESKIRFDLAILSNNDTIEAYNYKIIEGGKFAVATHHGEYKNLLSTYEYMLTSYPILFNKVIRNSPTFEIYLNPFPDEVQFARTEVFIPIV